MRTPAAHDSSANSDVPRRRPPVPLFQIASVTLISVIGHSFAEENGFISSRAVAQIGFQPVDQTFGIIYVSGHGPFEAGIAVGTGRECGESQLCNLKSISGWELHCALVIDEQARQRGRDGGRCRRMRRLSGWKGTCTFTRSAPKPRSISSITEWSGQSNAKNVSSRISPSANAGFPGCQASRANS